MVPLSALDGVEHKFVDVGSDVTIHVADAGPADGPVVMLVHGFPQNWWEWHALVGSLAEEGYRFFGLNTVALWPNRNSDGASTVRAAGDRRSQGALLPAAGGVGRRRVPEDDFWMYVELMGEPGDAVAGSRWYRTVLSSEMPNWLRGPAPAARV